MKCGVCPFEGKSEDVTAHSLTHIAASLSRLADASDWKLANLQSRVEKLEKVPA